MHAYIVISEIQPLPYPERDNLAAPRGFNPAPCSLGYLRREPYSLSGQSRISAVHEAGQELLGLRLLGVGKDLLRTSLLADHAVVHKDHVA